jgi:hypothetical protein
MNYNTFLIVLTFTILATIGCNGEQIDEKLFGFLKSAEKCLKDSNPKLCVKRNLSAWCEKRKHDVCGCVNDDSR